MARLETNTTGVAGAAVPVAADATALPIAASQAAADAHARFLATRVFGSLDGLRALAILAVVWHHAHPGTDWIATHRGFLGVDLFFVVSGFLIVTLLLRERDRRGAIDLRAFYVRRSLRIFPLAWTVVLALWAATTLLGSASAPAIAHDLPYALTYTANWAPMVSMLGITWSLAAEEQFYLLWPAVERWRPRAAVACCVSLIAASLWISCGHAHAGWFAGFPAMLVQTTFVPILLGVLLAHALHSPTGFARLWPLAGHRLAAPAAMALLVAIASLPVEDISGGMRLSFHLAMGWLVAACVCREDHAARALLEWPAIARVGAVSYGIYLLHLIGMHAANVGLSRLGLADPLWSFLATLVLTWVMAEVSFRTFERRFLARKERWLR